MTVEKAKEIVLARYPRAVAYERKSWRGTPKHWISRGELFYGALTNYHRTAESAWIRAAKNILKAQKKEGK